MDTELTPTEKKGKDVKVQVRGGSTDSIYGMGLIGAWVYYIGKAETTEEKVKAFFKGFAWPAFMVYDVLKFLEKGRPTSE